MITEIVTQTDQIVKTLIPKGDCKVLVIRAYDKKGEWQVEAIFEGGAKVTGPATQDEVTALESDLKDQGWQVDASLFCGGFNAKPVEVEELIFASSAGMWVDDYGLEPAL